MAILKGDFVSDYEEGFVRTPGTVNTETGEISFTGTEADDLATLFEYGSLKQRYFEDKDGIKYELDRKGLI